MHCCCVLIFASFRLSCYIINVWIVCAVHCMLEQHNATVILSMAEVVVFIVSS